MVKQFNNRRCVTSQKSEYLILKLVPDLTTPPLHKASGGQTFNDQQVHEFRDGGTILFPAVA
jgi:hypothetical protein